MPNHPFLSRLAPALLIPLLLRAALPVAACAAAPDVVRTSGTAAFVHAYSAGAQYYGAQLTGNSRIVYEALVGNIDKLRSGEELKLLQFPAVRNERAAAGRDAVMSAAVNAAGAFDRDFPDIFWLGDVNFTSTSAPDGNGMSAISLTLRYNISRPWTSGGRSIADDEAFVSAQRNALYAAAPKTSRYAMLLYFHDWLITNNYYNTPAVQSSSPAANGIPWEAISALDTNFSPVCEGYARAFKLLCDTAGIPCVLVNGDAREAHMWNYVQMEDGRWYAVDCTFDDPVIKGEIGPVHSGRELHDYFLVGTDTVDTEGVPFRSGHRPNASRFMDDQTMSFVYPKLNATAYDAANAAAAPPVAPPADPAQDKPEAGADGVFTDVDARDWFYDAVLFTQEQGLLNGTSATTFAPKDAMNRAMLVTCLWRMADAPVTTGGVFSDVPTDSWYTDAVRWAASLQVVDGVGDGRFAPMQDVTREQLAVIFHRFARMAEITVTGSGHAASFPDLSRTSSYAVDAVRWAIEGELLLPRADGMLAPNATATRAEVAYFLQQFLLHSDSAER